MALPAKHRLTGVDVRYISLAGLPKNGRSLILKSDLAAGEVVVTRETRIAKCDRSRRMAYGVVYTPDDVDADGHTMTAGEIEKAMLGFMAKGRVGAVDTDHDEQTGGAFVAESWLVKGAEGTDGRSSGETLDALFPSEPVGTWAVGIKVEDASTWGRITKGEITGLSFAGVAVLEPVTKGIIRQDGKTWDCKEVTDDAPTLPAPNDPAPAPNPPIPAPTPPIPSPGPNLPIPAPAPAPTPTPTDPKEDDPPPNEPAPTPNPPVPSPGPNDPSPTPDDDCPCKKKTEKGAVAVQTCGVTTYDDALRVLGELQAWLESQGEDDPLDATGNGIAKGVAVAFQKRRLRGRVDTEAGPRGARTASGPLGVPPGDELATDSLAAAEDDETRLATALQQVLAPLVERLDALEKVTPGRQSALGDVQKSAPRKGLKIV